VLQQKLQATNDVGLADLIERVEEAISDLNKFDDFLRYVKSMAGSEALQADVVRTFLDKCPLAGAEYLVRRWLALAENQGLVKRRKRSNRWWISVPSISSNIYTDF
jgi:hypothetical protein